MALKDILGQEEFTSTEINWEYTPELYEENDISEELLAVEQYEAVIDKCISVYTGLEGLLGDIQLSQATGGMTEGEARFAYRFLNSIEEETGVSMTREVPSFESFIYADGRLANTLGMEKGVWDTLKKWWEKIKQAIKNFFVKVQKFWAKYINFARVLASRADSLAEKAKESKGMPKEVTVNISEANMVKMMFGGEQAHSKQLESNLKSVIQLINKYGSGDSNYFSDVLPSIEKLIKEVENKADDPNKYTIDVADAAKEMLDKLKSDFESLTDGISGFRHSTFGPKSILVRAVSNASGKKDGLAITVGLIPDIKIFNQKQGENWPGLRSNEIESLAKTVKDVAKAIHKADYKPEKAKNKVDKALSDLDKALAKAKDKEKVDKDFSKVLKLATSFSQLGMQPGSFINDSSYKAASAAYDYAAKCYSNLK